MIEELIKEMEYKGQTEEGKKEELTNESLCCRLLQ